MSYPRSYDPVFEALKLTKALRANGMDAQHDPVNHPSHYTDGEIECIDALESALGVEGFRGYCIGNAMKYLWRYRDKGGLQDLSKSEWYLARAKQHMEKHNDD